MNEKELTKKSKFLSLVLRHKPEKIGLNLDENGWASVYDLTMLSKITPVELEEIVSTNNKKRFEYNSDKTKIRACQGHSINIDLGLTPQKPPYYLYHGTQKKFLDSIMKEGLIKGQRNHVHLSEDIEVAKKVGSRRGSRMVVLRITAEDMFLNGFEFYKSANGVWLIDKVEPHYIKCIFEE